MNVSHEELERRLSLPLEEKIKWAKEVIAEYWCQYEGKVYVSFSGGKDSQVLLHLVRSVFPNTPAVFCDTGLEYPEIRKHVKTFENVIWMKPKMKFTDVLENIGVAVGSKEVAQKVRDILTTKSEKLKNKRLNGDEKGNGKLPTKWRTLLNAPFKVSDKCCDIFKKEPFRRYEKESKRKPITGTTVEESKLRKNSYSRTGCNSFGAKPKSLPISIWKSEDVWEYARLHNIRFAEVYYDRTLTVLENSQEVQVEVKGADRTGCMFCMFGVHLEDKKKPNRFQRMAISHPRQYDFLMSKTILPTVLDYIGVSYKPQESCAISL